MADLFPQTPIEITFENFTDDKRRDFWSHIVGKDRQHVNFSEFYRYYIKANDHAKGSGDPDFQKTIDDLNKITDDDGGLLPPRPGGGGDDPVDPPYHPPYDPVGPHPHPIAPGHLVPQGHFRVLAVVELPTYMNENDVLLMEM